MFQHFIITRFSVRIPEIVKRKGLDPLNPHRLAYRLKLFQIGCLPSVMNQVCQDFIWLILVDPALPEEYRTALIRLTKAGIRTTLVPYKPECNYAALDWLRPWLYENTRTVATTHLDDDDALAPGFTKYIHDFVCENPSRVSLSPLLIMAGKTAAMWDLIADETAPYGYIKPDLVQRFPLSVGLTVCADTRINLSVFSIPHHLVAYLTVGEHGYPADIPQFETDASRVREMITKAVTESGLAREGSIKENMVHYFPDKPTMLMMLNHTDNVQMFRFLLEEERRIQVTNEERIPGFPVELELASQIARQNKPGLSWLIRMWVRAVRFRESYEKGRSLPYIIYRKLIGFRALFRFFLEMRKR
jgi:hypothetical protein